MLCYLVWPEFVYIYSQLEIFFWGETTPQLFLILSFPVNFKVYLIVLFEQILEKNGWVEVICIISVLQTATFLKWRTRLVVRKPRFYCCFWSLCVTLFVFLFFNLAFLLKLPFFPFSNLICKIGLIIFSLSGI